MSDVFLTGVTGFVGKVVLEELLRRRHELGVDRVRVLIRPTLKRGVMRSAAERFRKDVARAALFAGLGPGWERYVEVLSGDLEAPGCGLTSADLARLRATTTHVIHCAASVEFDLPVQQAARANITTALGVLELAAACPKLERMVDVSTAYVTPWRPGPLPEVLAHLPRSASEYHRAIMDGTRDEAELLAETGHPNTYTFTKCIAEHLLSERAGHVPLSIVRPSIVSASWRAPFPGWVDSPAALAGCLLYTGLGLVRAFNADPNVRLDTVPVDVCSHVIVETAFNSPAPIRYAAMGTEHALRIDMAAQSTIEYFRQRPGTKAVPGMFVGTKAHGFERTDRLRRELPNRLLGAAIALSGDKRKQRQLRTLDEKVRYLNSAFRYFTHHTFDFRSANDPVPEGFDPVAYMNAVNAGLYKHLLKMDERELPLAGHAHDDARADLAWLRERATGSLPMSALALGLRKALRQCTQITFDRASFERALRGAPADALLVLAPSHRSYFDFLLTSYLCFQHPELGINVPHIAAAEEFGKIPFVGALLRACRAFYIKRGVGKEVPELSDELRRIANDNASIMFFVEGQRSRMREFLQPKRGMLRGLQATGRTFAVLPIAIAYDRVPEEASLEREVHSGKRQRMSLRALLGWLGELGRGEVKLGRIHITCGAPLTLDRSTDVPKLARNIMAEQQRHMAVSRFHLRAFLADKGLGGIEEWLIDAIQARGGRMLDSNLPHAFKLSPTFQRSLRNQWMHWFYADALALFPHSQALREHIANHDFRGPCEPGDLRDPNLVVVVRALMEDIVEDQTHTVRAAKAPSRARAAHAEVLQ